MPDHTKPATALSQRVSMKAKLRGVSRVSLLPRAGLDLAGDGSSSSEKTWLQRNAIPHSSRGPRSREELGTHRCALLGPPMCNDNTKPMD